MVVKKIFLAALLAGIFVGAAPAFSIRSPSISVSTKTVTSPGAGIVNISAIPSDAWISVDGGSASFAGWAGTLSPGQHSISAWARDHYSSQFLLVVEENTSYTVSLELEPHTGFLALEIQPPDAEVFVDGQKIQGSLVEIPVGRRTIRIKKFGYDEHQLSLTVRWQRISVLNIGLKPSVFEVKAWSLRPEIFNPSNKGSYGRTVLSFSVTAPGKGLLEISDSSGIKRFERELPVFTTWSQRFVWQGRDDREAALPDGEYLFKISLWPLPESGAGAEKASATGDGDSSAVDSAPTVGGEPDNGATVSFTTRVRIDSSRIIAPSGAQAARPGLLYFPDPKIARLLPGSAEILGTYPRGASLALGFKLGPSTMMALEGSFDVAPAGGLGLSFLQGFAAGGKFDLGVLGRFAWNSDLSPSYPGAASEAEISLPLAASFGGLRFGAAPGLVYDFNTRDIEGRAGLGLWYENQSILTGISAQSDFGGAAPVSASNPLRLALEARVLLDSTPLTFMLRISGDLSPALSSPTASLGFGVVW
ncbi:MAG TPA: hypothetical protein PLD45_03095 [Spirochaetales bacterium]|nr:hypothetical protein [Spirochaetales bacterium]